MSIGTILNEWQSEVIKKYGDSGYTIVSISRQYVDEILIETSAYGLWMGAQGRLFDKYKSKLKKIGCDVCIKHIKPNTIYFK